MLPAMRQRRRCFLITLREPAQRLASAMRNELQAKYCTKTSSRLRCLTALVEGGRRPLHSLIDDMRCQNRSVPSVTPNGTWIPFGQLTADGKWLQYANMTLPSGEPLLIWLMPQLDYLRGIDQAAGVVTELRFVCTEQLRVRWHQLMRLDPSGSASSLLNHSAYLEAERNLSHMHARSSRVNAAEDARQRNALSMTALVDVDRSIIHTCLFRHDYQLHRTVCGERPELQDVTFFPRGGELASAG